MSTKFPNAHFLNVDVDECQETAASYGVTAMPTFIFLRNKTRLALLKGADKAGLEAKIQQFYTDASQDEEVGVKGMVRNSDFKSGYAHLHTYRISSIRSRPCVILNPKFPRLVLQIQLKSDQTTQ